MVAQVVAELLLLLPIGVLPAAAVAAAVRLPGRAVTVTFANSIDDNHNQETHSRIVLVNNSIYYLSYI